MRKFTFMATLAVVTFGLASVASATGGVWAEVGDASDAPIGASQATIGTGPLTAITGSMIWDPAGDHVDAYCITVTDPVAFYASTDPGEGGYFLDDGGFEDDSRLYLFEMDGTLVMANDDKPAASLESYISDPSTFPGTLTNSPGSLVAGQKYVLAVTYYDNKLMDAADESLVTFSPFDALHGVNPLAGAASHWSNLGDFDSGWDYQIALGGATYCTVPEPASLALIGLGSLVMLRRRR